MQRDWHSNIYGKKRKKRSETVRREEWRTLRKFIFIRDKYTCFRCGKISKGGQGISPHHLIPREEGGPDDQSNLIILCHPCHDFIELSDYRTLDDIILSREDVVVEVANKKVDVSELLDHPDWHAWVYGGARNPSLDK